MKLKKSISFLLITLISLSIITFFSGCSSSTDEEEEDVTRSFTVEVEASGYDTHSLDESTDDTYLGEFLRDKGIISGTQGKERFEITEVDGITASDNQVWTIYEDDEEQTEDVDLIPIKDGATYRFVLTDLASTIEDTSTSAS